ncbi:MAG: N-acetyltransferase family protein, partial [Alphaproteobacteria bacterium]
MTSLRARRALLSDAEAVAAIYAPYVTDSVVSFEAEAPSAEEMRARIADIGASYPWIVADDNGRIAGYVYASQHIARAAYQWSANVTAYLHPDYHRRELGKQLYRLLFALLQRQGFRSLYGGITLPNAASEALHRFMGMSPVGIYQNVGFKFGAWRDVIWYGLSF